MQHPTIYYELMNEAERMRNEAIRMVSDMEDDLKRRFIRKGYLDKADQTDWDRVIADADSLHAASVIKERDALQIQYQLDNDHHEWIMETQYLRHGG